MATQLPSGNLAPGQVRAVEVEGEPFVCWRGYDGTVRSGPRICPHLDFDLAEGYVVDTELVCAGHGWEFDGTGRAAKRNEAGRIDPKGTVPVLEVREADGIIELHRSPDSA